MLQYAKPHVPEREEQTAGAGRVDDDALTQTWSHLDADARGTSVGEEGTPKQ